MPTRNSIRSATLIICALCGVGACGPGYKAGIGYGVKTNDTRSRLTPTSESILPEGVAQGHRLRVIFPPGTSLSESLTFYLRAARERGALWFSRTRLIDAASGCNQALMPENLTRNQEVVYLRKEQYWGGATDHTFERKNERAKIPYIRQIDDLASIIEEVNIWISNNAPVCEPARTANNVLKLEGLIHGREAIGLLKGSEEIDLAACFVDHGSPKAQDPGAKDSEASLILGDMAYLEIAEKTLPKWIGRFVQIVHGDELVTGKLKRYSRQILSIEKPDGTMIDVHFMDALAVELAGGAAVAAPSDDTRSPAPECGTWRRGLREL